MARSLYLTLVVDMQVDFFGHERLVRRRAELARNVNNLVSLSRDAGAPVVWVKQEFSSDLSDAMLEARRRNARVVIAGSQGAALLPELHVAPGDEVLVKKRYSAFFGTELDALLARNRPETLIVAGINTHACVRTTVIDAYQRDYNVILPSDCIDSYDREHHDVSLRYMNGKMGRAMNNAEIGQVL